VSARPGSIAFRSAIHARASWRACDASCDFEGGAEGSFDVVAHYGGDAIYKHADSASVAHTIARAETTIVLSPGGFSVATEPVHFFANLGSVADVDGGTVTIGAPDGQLTFSFEPREPA